MLPLDDHRWDALRHAYGHAGDVPDLLRALERGDDRVKHAQFRDDLWFQIYSALCHQGTIYTASYAAVPHIVAIGEARPRDEQVNFLAFVGAVAGSRDAAPAPPSLKAAYEGALAVTEQRARACLVQGISEESGLALLVTIAQLRAERLVGSVIESLELGDVVPSCPACGTQLYVAVTSLPYFAANEVPVRASAERMRGKGRSTPVEPTTPRKGLVDAAELARAAGLDALAERILGLEGDVVCPSCETRFSLIDEAEG